MTNAATKHRPEAARRARQRSRVLYAGVGLGVILLAILVAVLSTGERDATVSVEELAGDPAISGEPLPTAPGDPASDPAVGTAGPVVEGAGFDGASTTIGDTGSPQLVLFLASWCPACQQELPEVVSWLDRGGLPDEVGLVAVATGLDASRPNWPPDAWLEGEGYTDRVLVDDGVGSVARAYGLSGTPFWVALDAEGRVVARLAGRLDAGGMTALAEAARAGSG